VWGIGLRSYISVTATSLRYNASLSGAKMLAKLSDGGAKPAFLRPFK